MISPHIHVYLKYSQISHAWKLSKPEILKHDQGFFFFFFTRLTQPLAIQRRGWKQSYPNFLAADCEQIRCGLPHEGCCIRLRSSAPPEGIQGNSSHSRKRKQCGPLGWRQRKIHQGPKCGVEGDEKDLKKRLHKWWLKKKGACGGCISPQAALALGPLSPPGLGYWRKCHSSVHHHLETEELPSLYRDNKYEKS